MTLFVYGSLKNRNVLTRLIGHVPQMRSAVLRGYSLCRPPLQRWKMYWMAVPRRGSVVRGKLLLGLKKKDMTKLHDWEETKEKIWTRRRIVVLVDKKRIKTLVYLGNEKYR